MRRKSLLLAILFLISFRNSIAQDILFDLKGTAKIILEDAGFELSEVLNAQEDIALIGKVYNIKNQLIKAKIKFGLSDGIKTFYSNSIKKTDSDRAIQLKQQGRLRGVENQIRIFP